MSGLAPMPNASTDRPRLHVVREENSVVELVSSLRLRFLDMDERELTSAVTAALDDLGPVRVTSFLPILVERHIRDRRGHETRRIGSH